MADKIGYLLLFISLTAVVVAAGIAVGMLVAGRIDRLTTPRPSPSRDAGQDVAAAPAAIPAEGDEA